MLSIEDALAAIYQTCAPLSAELIALDDSAERVLHEAAISDIDSPPYDKALMDGYALQASDGIEGAELQVVEEISAGDTPQKTLVSGQAARIMTGAPLPEGANAVIMLEQTESDSASHVRLQASTKPEQNLLRQGVAMQNGTTVLPAGHRIRPVDIGLLAEAGNAEVSVHAIPTVGVLATGNEIVPCDKQPGPGQIRNSNAPMLTALASRIGANATNLGAVGDDLAALTERIRQGLKHDLLLLSGGVSAGDYDLVPQALAAAGVKEVFHKVNLKPGKPLWFGHAENTIIFGLPGNPVSSMVCCELFVSAAIRRLSGQKFTCKFKASPIAKTVFQLPLMQSYEYRGPRPTFLPGSLQRDGATAIQTQGSADIQAWSDADGLIFLEGETRTVDVGELVSCYLLTE